MVSYIEVMIVKRACFLKNSFKGKEIQLAMVSVPHNYVFCVSRTPQIEVPSNMSELISGIKLIASTIWKAKAVMNETISAIDSVKDVNSVDE